MILEVSNTARFYLNVVGYKVGYYEGYFEAPDKWFYLNVVGYKGNSFSPNVTNHLSFI